MTNTNRTEKEAKDMVKKNRPGDAETYMIQQREDARDAIREKIEGIVDAMIDATGKQLESLQKEHAALVAEGEQLRGVIDALYRRRARSIEEYHAERIREAQEAEDVARAESRKARTTRDELSVELRISRNGGRATTRRKRPTQKRFNDQARLAGAVAEATEKAAAAYRRYEAAVSARKAAEAARDRAVAALQSGRQEAKRPRPVRFNNIQQRYVPIAEATI